MLGLRAWLGLAIAAPLLLVVAAEPPGRYSGDLAEWVKDLSGTQKDVAQIPWRDSSSAAPAVSQGGTPADFRFPTAQRWEIVPGIPAPAGVPVNVEEKSPSGKAVSLEVLDRAVAQRIGVSGMLFKTSKVDGPVRLSVDYSPFANAFGGNYADRLRLIALPGCVLEGCTQQGKPVPATNDVDGGTLTADVAALDGVSVLAVVSGVGGEQGTFAASPLSLTGSWQVSPGSGAFSYTYPFSVPKPGAGTAPQVSMSYSSSAIDGMTMAANTQANPVGLGWSDFANAFIERRYEQCYRIHLPDLCWKSDNAVLSLGGVSGTLLAVNSANTLWKLQSDPGWRIERNSNAQYTNTYGTQQWEVTGPDGTRYIFGGGQTPSRQTNSILGVRVLADDAGEPCRGPGDTFAACEQGWRWYLDRIIDPDGNETAFLYEREENIYSAIGGLGDNHRYHRGAVLKEIIYGGNSWQSPTYSARVLFDTEERCAYLVPACPSARQNSTGFHDVPVDLICDSLTKGTCQVHTPSFFTSKRYSFVRTEVKVGGSQWKPATKHKIVHAWGDEFVETDKVARKLHVKAVQQIGTSTNMPATTFGFQYLNNRADHDFSPTKASRHLRINSITNPFGGKTTISYGQNRPCAANYQPPVDPIPRWDGNVRDCFPQAVRDNAFTGTGIYHKYLVMAVSEHDGFTADALKTTYTYEDDPAWAFDFSAFERDQAEIGWSLWRGYSKVSIRKGSSWTRLTLFRGWDRDYIIKKVGAGWAIADRPVSVQASDNSSFVDDSALAGRVLEEQKLGTIDGQPGRELEKRIHLYVKRVIHPMPEYRFPVEWVGLASTTEYVAIAAGLFRRRQSLTTYNANFQPATTKEEGWLDVSGDERCSITTYADDAARNMFVYPSGNRKVAGTCASTNVLTESHTYYDSSTTLGALPGAGNPTMQRVHLGGGTWSQTVTDFDARGRPVKVTGPTGAPVTTTYDVAPGGSATEIPARTVVTNALGHQQITDYQQQFGVPIRQQDANGNVTTFGYDEFGRTVSIWLPTETPGSANPSWRFSYDIPNRAIRSQRLTACCTTVTYEDTWVIYDGLWRQRQVQARSTEATKVLVAETTYDGMGLVRDETVEQAFTGIPGKFFNAGSAWLNRTRRSYDELGREVLKEWLRPTGAGHSTSTVFGPDTVSVTGPAPESRRVRERVDGLGRTIAVEEFDGSGWATSNYKYDLADRLTAAIDPAGNKVEYAYNLAGWRVGQIDPNRGNAFFGYDLAGRQTAVATDSGIVHTSYDALGRPLQRRADSTTGPLLAAWQYDTAPKGLGKPHRETTGAGWVNEILGYDARGRSTGSKLVVPAGIAGLSGSYAMQFSYDLADRVRSTQLPAIGGLPAETVTTDYNNLGLATRVAGLEEYVSALAYDDRGRRLSAAFGPKPGGNVWMAKQWTFDIDQKINGSKTLIAGNVVSEHRLVFDNSGNLTENLTTQNGLAWRECFGYDARARLVAAHTVASAATCASGTPGTGDRAYKHSYQHSPDGKLLTRTENGVSTGYTYPAAGGARPHAPTRVGADTYTWDAEGKLVSRTVAGQPETFAWDKQDRLTSITGGTGATSFLYDASGQRLLRRTPDGRSTLYYAGHEITVNSAGVAVSAVRPYTLDGKVVATRSLQGVQYLVSGPTGSVEIAYPASSTTPAMTRSYLPYGRVRAETGDTATDRGFIGQIEDPSTKLSYLNDRYYDTRIGVFISADALFDTSKLKSLNPYTYATGNPATLADPSGLYSASAFGLELENLRLRTINKELMAHIGRLNHQIAEMQDVIRKQADAINKMFTYIEALEAEIARQASIIEQLEAKVAQLQRVVAAQQREISRLRRVVAHQQSVIGYYKGVVDVLGLRLWGGTPHHAQVMQSIHSFRGIPSWAFAVDNISVLQASVYQLTVDLGNAMAEVGLWKGRYYGASNTASHLRAHISELKAEIFSLQSERGQALADHQELINKTDPALMSAGERMCHYGTSSGSLWHGSASGGTAADVMDFLGDAAGIVAQFGPVAPTNMACDIVGANG